MLSDLKKHFHNLSLGIFPVYLQLPSFVLVVFDRKLIHEYLELRRLWFTFELSKQKKLNNILTNKCHVMFARFTG